MEYQKSLEQHKKQKEIEMNLDGLLDGIFQIRMPDYLIHELVQTTADSDENIYVNHDGKPPVKLLISDSATASGAGTAAFATNNDSSNPMGRNEDNQVPKATVMEDYQQSLGEMQMI